MWNKLGDNYYAEMYIQACIEAAVSKGAQMPTH